MIAMNNLAWFLCEEKSQYQEALTLANRGLERAPEYLDLIDTRGIIHYRMGNREDAVKDFGRFIELCPPSTPSLVITRFHLARVYLEEGNLVEAARQLDQISGLEDGTSGLSAADQAEAKLLLDRVKKGS
jgi:tetratricopeptide (TPR) repeat protein